MSVETIDFKRIAELSLQVAPNILLDICPGGKVVGKEYVAGSINGGEGRSFSFNTLTGKWADFQAGDRGGDIISLYAKAKNMQMLNAAKEIDKKFLGGLELKKNNYPVAKVKSNKTIKPPKNEAPPVIDATSTRWCYRDLNGDPLFYIVRGINHKEKTKFYYPQCFSSDGEWTKKHYHAPVLYNLDKIYNDKNTTKIIREKVNDVEVVREEPDERWILVVEGEKAAVAAEKIMNPRFYTVTTWPAGVNNWKKCDWTPLTGRKVLLWPDADDLDPNTNIRPGQDCMNKILMSISGLVKQIKFIDVAKSDKGGGWDAHDAVEEGWNFKKFQDWAKPLTREVTKAIVAKPVEHKKTEVLNPETGVTHVHIDFLSADEMIVDENNEQMYLEAGVTVVKGRWQVNAANVAKIINFKYKGIVWRDEFYNENRTTWNVRPGEPPRNWTEDDDCAMMVILQSKFGVEKVTKSHVSDAINYIALSYKKNEAQDWLNKQKWDGIPRIDEFFITAMRADDCEWSRVVSKNFWLSLAARILQPGCQVDEMVVLESKQGAGKTSALRLIGGQWYGDVNADLRNKDFDQSLKGKILVEFGELGGMRDADIDLVKRKVTTVVDQYRPSYGKSVGKFPRTCIFAASTNEKEYFRDLTGNRRFNPLPVGKADLDYVKNFREQFFAEAAARVKDKEAWWIYPEALATEIRRSRMEVNEWDFIISDFLVQQGDLHYFTLQEIYSKALGGVEILKNDGKIQKKIASCMRRLGYKSSTDRLGDTAKRVWKKETP